MVEMLLSSPYVVLATQLVFILFLALSVASLVLFERSRRAYPRATEWADLGERIERRRSELAIQEEKLDQLNRQIGDRDRLVAEISALQEQRDAVRLEMDGLSDARAQIDDVKRQAAEAATELAKRQDELADLQKHREEAAELQSRVDELKAQFTSLPKELIADIASLKSTLANLEVELDEKRAERGALRTEVAAARDELATTMKKSDVLRGEIPALAETIAKVKADLDALQAAWLHTSEQVEQARDEEAQVRNELAGARNALTEALAGTQELAARKEILHSKISELESSRTKVQEEIESLNLARRDENGNIAFSQEMLEDLKMPPVVLGSSDVPSLRHSPPETEEDALRRVELHLKAHALEYPQRVLHAFHTALKINDVAQLTVLAGVSGTGKSLLPRRYAEAMGIRFLPIAVEPRWDSPQDLLGFYNYIEKKFRATELARALVHLDPYNTSGLAHPGGEAGFSDDVMIVLLDEMNLARVEYYFSEFLSRLEARPSIENEKSASQRRDSEIPIDIRGRKEGAVRLYPPHNMLFVGTMNDDESTQALSEKVLDRGNVMQFAAPTSFGEVKSDTRIVKPDHRLSFKTWKGWIQKSEGMASADRNKTKEIISELQNIMSACGRPFGHRLNAAITAYVANYPKGLVRGGGVDRPLADQIELRILPKLRGLPLDTESGTKAFEDLRRLIEERLGDISLAQTIHDLHDRQSSNGGLFNWRGLDRMNKD